MQERIHTVKPPTSARRSGPITYTETVLCGNDRPIAHCTQCDRGFSLAIFATSSGHFLVSFLGGFSVWILASTLNVRSVVWEKAYSIDVCVMFRDSVDVKTLLPPKMLTTMQCHFTSSLFVFVFHMLWSCHFNSRPPRISHCMLFIVHFSSSRLFAVYLLHFALLSHVISSFFYRHHLTSSKTCFQISVCHFSNHFRNHVSVLLRLCFTSIRHVAERVFEA